MDFTPILYQNAQTGIAIDNKIYFEDLKVENARLQEALVSGKLDIWQKNSEYFDSILSIGPFQLNRSQMNTKQNVLH